jgi:hypothetical protein
LSLPHWYKAVVSTMRVSMSLFQNQHGVWCVRKKVPKALEQAVATVLGNGKKRQPWLQRSLRTKDKQEAKRLAPPILMELDRVLAEAEASRGGRQRGTPNKSTLLKNAAFKAAAIDPNLSPLDFLLTLMRQGDLPLELRVAVAHQALPLAHRKLKPSKGTMGAPGRSSTKRSAPG